MSAELDDAVRELRLKLRAARGLIRDLLAATARCEDLLTEAHSPKEAQRDDDQHPHRAAA